MKRKLSLRLRLTLATSLLLTLTCGLFTAFGFYNTSINVVDTIAAQMTQISIPATEIVPAQSVGVLPATEMEPLIAATAATTAPNAPFSAFSFIFMGVAILLGSVGMYVLCGIALKPAKKLAKEISAIDSSSLSTRIEDFRGGDELQSISLSFNHLMERLETAFARESRFSAAAAHELKTPLTVIKTNLEVLSLDDAPSLEDYAASVEVVKKQTERMRTLVNQLTLLSGSGEIPLDEKVNLKKIVEEILRELNLKGLSLHTALAPVSFTGNELLLKHAFSNLIHNAIRYNCKNGTLEIILCQTQLGCTFTVRDSGIGIDEKDAPHIFEPFYRADKSRSRALGGTGLGLSLVKEIVEQHNGSITYEKNSPQGSVFTITLPCC